MQLNKYLSYAGVCSRRKAAECVKLGMVKINGVIVKEPGYRVLPKDQVVVNGSRVAEQKKRYIVMNKPKDFVSTTDDEKGRKTVFDLLPRTISERLHTVGRLDRMTTGLIILTNDGELTQHLAHPSNGVVKKYRVLLDKSLEYEDRKKLTAGVRLMDGWARVDSVICAKPNMWHDVYVTLHSGKYRVIRRIFEELGYEVRLLDRVKLAFLSKDGIPVGQWRHLEQDEIKKLFSAQSGYSSEKPHQKNIVPGTAHAKPPIAKKVTHTVFSCKNLIQPH